MDSPVGTVSAGGTHHALVASFLRKYGPASAAASDPRVHVGDEDYYIADIGMRMLAPHELARAMGFPEWFRFEINGVPLTKRDATKMIGNACPVGTTKALVKAAVLRSPGAYGLLAS
jgi:DNA (cytosine-5)-methyltransferase 1